MNKEKTKRKIIKAIRENFTIRDENFAKDTDPGFIEMSVSDEFDSHSEFGEKLSEILNKVFPENKNPIVVNNCDTVDDILDNNFKF